MFKLSLFEFLTLYKQLYYSKKVHINFYIYHCVINNILKILFSKTL